MNAARATRDRDPRARSLSALLAGLVEIPAASDCAVRGISCISQQVGEGELFLALPGGRFHGLDFYPQVRAAGAVAVAVSDATPLPQNFQPHPDCPLLVVPRLAERVAMLADRAYADPSRALRLIGVTGTDGKTSCAHFLAQALSSASSEERCGLMGTLGYGTLDDPFLGSPSGGGLLTTPDAVTIRRWLAAVIERGAARAVMEVSSHALAQRRPAELQYDVALLTNLTRDHLDYHADLAAYQNAKRRLFTDFQPRVAVLNLDDPFGLALRQQLDAESATATAGYGFVEDLSAVSTCAPDVFAAPPELRRDGLRMLIKAGPDRAQLDAGLLGRFNASNVLASLATLLALGIPFSEAIERLRNLRTAPGRMERVASDESAPLVVVDYAHTPHALAQALRALREHLPRAARLWCVFGCGGDRDAGKRPLMGAVARRFADVRVITSDNPRSESAPAIAEQIIAGMGSAANTTIELDRRVAIGTALQAAGADDIVLIAGKGHEDYQETARGRVPFSDRDVAREWLERAA